MGSKTEENRSLKEEINLLQLQLESNVTSKTEDIETLQEKLVTAIEEATALQASISSKTDEIETLQQQLLSS